MKRLFFSVLFLVSFITGFEPLSVVSTLLTFPTIIVY